MPPPPTARANGEPNKTGKPRGSKKANIAAHPNHPATPAGKLTETEGITTVAANYRGLRHGQQVTHRHWTDRAGKPRTGIVQVFALSAQE